MPAADAVSAAPVQPHCGQRRPPPSCAGSCTQCLHAVQLSQAWDVSPEHLSCNHQGQRHAGSGIMAQGQPQASHRCPSLPPGLLCQPPRSVPLWSQRRRSASLTLQPQGTSLLATLLEPAKTQCDCRATGRHRDLGTTDSPTQRFEHHRQGRLVGLTTVLQLRLGLRL